MTEKYWMGDPPEQCDLGGRVKGTQPHAITDTFIDGKTAFGPWANMCPDCFNAYGVGLGTGRGQKYQLQPNGRWLKVGG